MDKGNIFNIFYHQATKNEKSMIISLCLLYSFCSSGIIGLPLWFIEPKLLCQNPENSLFYSCSEADMCSNSLIYEIDWTSSPSTLVSQLNLFCDRKLIKRLILSMIFFGGFVGCLTNFLIYIKPEKRLKVLACLGILFALSNYLILFFSHSEIIVGISLASMMFACMIGNAYGFIIINEYFSGDLAKTATILMTLTWGTFGICFGFFAYLIHSNWKLLFFTMGTLVILDSLYLLGFKNEKGIKETLSKAPTNVYDFLKEISRIPQIRNNYLIYIFIWTATSVTYNDILMELSTLGGNFYVNMMMVSGVEILSSLSASIISLKFSISVCLRRFTGILIILFASFMFSPVDQDNTESSLYTVILLICMLIGKLISETICNLTYVYAPKIITDKFVPYYLVSVRLFSRIFLLFLPHINYLFRRMTLHAFLFLSLVWGLARFLQGFTKEVQPEGIEEILNEFKINLLSRMSIITGSRMSHYGPDELLRNLEVDGLNLSLIKKSRIQTSHLSLMGVHFMPNEHKLSLNDNLLI